MLLLQTKRAGKGLNIIAATHVFLVEPMLSPDFELQALGTTADTCMLCSVNTTARRSCCCADGCAGRVDRIGQTKPTFVHRFIADDTVETVILRRNRQAMTHIHRTFLSGGGGHRHGGGEEVLTRDDVVALFLEVKRRM